VCVYNARPVGLAEAMCEFESCVCVRVCVRA